MAISSPASAPGGAPISRVLGRTRLGLLISLLALLILCAIFSWTTRRAMEHLQFLRGQGSSANGQSGAKTHVDLRPWLTAQALAPLAVTAEEAEYARDAERLADHEVDQAFTSALRLAGLQAQRLTLTGDALALSQRDAYLQELVNEDQAQVKRLTTASSVHAGAAKDAGQPVTDDDDLDIAKAQLGLDSDQLAEAQQDLDCASGDDRAQLQAELSP